MRLKGENQEIIANVGRPVLVVYTLLDAQMFRCSAFTFRCHAFAVFQKRNCLSLRLCMFCRFCTARNWIFLPCNPITLIANSHRQPSNNVIIKFVTIWLDMQYSRIWQVENQTSFRRNCMQISLQKISDDRLWHNSKRGASCIIARSIEGYNSLPAKDSVPMNNANHYFLTLSKTVQTRPLLYWTVELHSEPSRWRKYTYFVDWKDTCRPMQGCLTDYVLFIQFSNFLSLKFNPESVFVA